jgi:hypothetical protein
VVDSNYDTPDEWDEIHGFESPGEFERFRRWIADVVENGSLVEIPVGSPYSGSPMFDEHWYRTTDGVVWRVVAPDPPFRGVFERVP